MWNNNADVTDVLITHIAKWHHITRCSHIVLHVFFFWVFKKKFFCLFVLVVKCQSVLLQHKSNLPHCLSSDLLTPQLLS